MTDAFGRVIRDLRVSLTDRCSFRCVYCLPDTEQEDAFLGAPGFRAWVGGWTPERRSGWEPGAGTATAVLAPPQPVATRAPLPSPRPQGWLPREQILTFEEIERIVRVAVALGVRKVRLTGGEPLLRKGIEQLVARLAAVPGIADLALTTNGFLFPQLGRALQQAGLRRVTFSLDSLDEANFARIAGRNGLRQVLESVNLARDLGLQPIKVNAVIVRGMNDHELERLAGWAADQNVALRFIEFMPLDASRAWLKESVVPGREILERLRRRFALEPIADADASVTARRWALAGGRGEVGIIAPVTQPFCRHCNRIRLTAEGRLRTCLFGDKEHALKPLLRGGATDAELMAHLRAWVWEKEERHHIGEPEFVPPARTMSSLGG